MLKNKDAAFEHGKNDNMLKEAAKAVDVLWSVHPQDHIFNFLINNPVFPNEQSKINYYFNDGLKSASTLHQLIEDYSDGAGSKVRLLEFASGYGCVSRHLKKDDKLNLTSCDIHPEAISFLSQTLGVNAIPSHAQPEMLELSDNYDVVFALSFFSHMPITTWARWLVRLVRAARTGGLVVFTTQGMKSRPHLGNPPIGEFGFHFQRTSEQKDLPLDEYGNTIATQDFVRKHVQTIPQVTEVEFREGYWWNHQDLFVLRKVAEL
jgi:Methyltransferase domain